MESEIIKHKSKTIARIYFPCVNYKSRSNNKSELISRLSEEIDDSDGGYAGFNTKKNLKKYLREMVFNKAGNNNRRYIFSFNKAKIVKTILKTIKKCFKVLPGRITNIFVFPTFSRFVKKEMSSSTGYTPWSDIILILINPSSLRNNKVLEKTVAHEFNHSVFLRDKKCVTLLDSIIFEGLAEHFCEWVIGGDQAPWTKIFDLNINYLTLEDLNGLQKNPESARHAGPSPVFGQLRWK